MNYYYFSFSEATQTQDTSVGRGARENESFRHPTEAAGSDPTQPPLFLFASLSLLLDEVQLFERGSKERQWPCDLREKTAVLSNRWTYTKKVITQEARSLCGDPPSNKTPNQHTRPFAVFRRRGWRRWWTRT